MTDTTTTFCKIQKDLIINLISQRKILQSQLVLAQKQYRIACDNYGYISKEARKYEKMIFAMQNAIENLSQIK